MMTGSKGLSSVFNDREIMLSSDRIDGRHVGRLTVDADRHDRFSLVGDRCLDLSWIHVPGGFIDVDKDWLRTDEGDHFRCGDPGVGNRDNFIARSDAQGHEGYEKGVCATRSPNAMLDTDVRG